jgi:hypothetical protein
MAHPETECYRVKDVLPTALAAALPEGFVRAFGKDGYCSGLGVGLEKTSAVLRNRFGSPRLLVERTPRGNFLCCLRFDGSDHSVSALLTSRETTELYPVSELYRALPAVFESYYQWFEGMQLLRPGEEPSLDWLDLPCAYNGRVELTDLSRSDLLPAGAVKSLYARLGSKSLQAWVRCSSGDLFFADEFNKRGWLFHFHKNDVEKVSMVDGEGFLDEYLSFVIAGGEPGRFALDPWLVPLNLALARECSGP